MQSGAQARSVPGAIQPGVDFADGRHCRGAAFRGRQPGGALLFGRPKGSRRESRGLRQTRRLQPLPGQTALEPEAVGEGLTLVRLGAQPVHFVTVLIDLIAMGIDRGEARTGRNLGRDRAGDGGEGGGQGDQTTGHDGNMGRDIRSGKRSRNPRAVGPL